MSLQEEASLSTEYCTRSFVQTCSTCLILKVVRKQNQKFLTFSDPVISGSKVSYTIRSIPKYTL
jgi:hypothetical protein